MMGNIDKRARAALFRERLAAAMAQAGANRSALARAIGVDRSTLSQLLIEDETRLPNSHVLAELATALGVSADWLLSLSDRPERPGDLIAASVRVTTAERASIDEEMIAWHREAKGYKIRHVPATLPDILKTPDVLNWEYKAFLSKTPDQALAAKMDRLDLLRSGDSDYEIAIPRHEIEAFATGTGYYESLSTDIRRTQLRALQTYCEELYPSLRLFIFDARKLFSAPVTIFGPIMAVIYVGRFYLAFRSDQRVRSLTQHFDWLVRECDIDARDATTYMAGLTETLTTASDG